MKKQDWGIMRIAAVAAMLGAQCGCASAEPAVGDTSTLELIRTVRLEGVTGRMDHLVIDAKGRHLWLAALANNTIEIIDLEAVRRVHTIDVPGEPQGVCLIPELNRIVVASSEDGMCRMFDDSFNVVASVNSLDDADNLRYDPREKRVYVGYGRGALAILDSETGARLGDIRLAGHPESFQLEQEGRRIFVNLPTAGHVAVVDRDTEAVVATWPVTAARANYPMALDEAHRRLLIVCRKPPRLLVLDTESGKSVAALECCGDADDIFLDSARNRVYVSGGEGCISVFERIDADRYRSVGTIATASGARTSLFVPQTGRLYLAVPSGTDHGAELREYRIRP